MKVGLLGLLLGIGVNLVSPGNWRRLSLYEDWVAQNIDPQEISSAFIHFIIQDALTPSLLIWGLCMLVPLLLFYPSQQGRARFTMSLSLIFFLAALVTLLPLLLTPRELFAGQHTAFYFSYFFILACAMAFGATETDLRERLGRRQIILAVAVAVILAKIGGRDIWGGYQLLAFEKKRLEYIAHQKENGVEDMILPFVSPYFKLYSIREDQLTGANTRSPVNVAAAQLYGVRSLGVAVNAPIGFSTSPEILVDIINGQRLLYSHRAQIGNLDTAQAWD